MAYVYNAVTRANNLGQPRVHISSTEIDQLEEYPGLKAVRITVGEDVWRPAISRGQKPWKDILPVQCFDRLPFTCYLCSGDFSLRMIQLRPEKCEKAENTHEKVTWETNVGLLEEWIQFRLDLRRGILLARGEDADDDAYQAQHYEEIQPEEDDVYFYQPARRCNNRLDSVYDTQHVDADKVST